MSRLLNRSRSPLWLHALLGLALAAAQLLGLLHRVEHGGLTTVAHASAATEQSAHSADAAFGHAAGQAEQCRLYDQLALSDLLFAAVAAELPSVDVASPPVLAAIVSARPAALAGYLARAPPERA